MKKKLFTLLLALVAGLIVQAQTTVEWSTAPNFTPNKQSKVYYVGITTPGTKDARYIMTAFSFYATSSSGTADRYMAICTTPPSQINEGVNTGGLIPEESVLAISTNSVVPKNENYDDYTLDEGVELTGNTVYYMVFLSSNETNDGFYQVESQLVRLQTGNYPAGVCIGDGTVKYDLLPAFKATLTTNDTYTVRFKAFSNDDGEMFDFFTIEGIVGQMPVPTYENYVFSHATLPDGTKFDVTQDITKNMELYFYYNPLIDIKYVIRNSKGKDIFSATVSEVWNTTITQLPAELDKSLFYDYSEINFVVDKKKTIYVTATMKKNPLVAFNEDESGEIIYNKLILKGSNYLYYVDDYPNVGLATERPENETSEWAFVGNPYEGFKIKNHATGSEMVLGSADPTQDGRTGGDTYATLGKEGSQPYENWTLRPSNSYTNGFFIFNDDGKALHMRDGKVAYWTGGYDAGSTFMAERVLTTEQLLEEAQKQLEELTAGANEVQIGYPNADALAAFKSAIETAAGDIAGGVVDEKTICDALKAAIAEVKSPANAVYTPRTDVYYTITNARGSMVYDPAHAEDMDADGNEFLWYANELNKDDANHQWGFIEQNGVYYMYNVGKKLFAGVTTANPQVEGKNFFANGAWMFSNAPSTVTLDAGIEDWVPTPKVRVQATSAVTGDTYVMSISTSYTGPVITYDAKYDGSIPMVFAVAKTEQDSEVTEAIKELLSNPAPFRQALEVAIATANERLSKLPDYPIGDGLNEYTLSGNPEAVTAAIEAAQTVLANENATQEELSAALATLNNASDELSLSLNMPKAGMWLRFTAAAHGTMLSATPVESPANRMALVSEADGSTVFYFDGNTLTSLDRGLAVTGRDAGKAGVEGVNYWFEESVLTPGKYCIRFNPDGGANRFLWAWDPSKGYADQNRVDNANCAFIIEDVKELPLTMPYQDGDKYFAAISLPTSVAEVNGANVQNVFMKDGKAIYEPAGTKGIPANTGVLLMGGNQVVTLVLGDCNEAPSNNALLPLEKSSADFTEGLVLGQPEDKIGFWEPEIWYAIDEEGGEIETKPARGFNAYLSLEMAGSNGVELVKKVNSGLLLNAENFPDANFRTALASILGISEGDEITEAKIAATTELDVSSKQIADLTGIEHFTALKELYCWNNQLTALDVSKNTAMEFLGCDNNQLTSLDILKNTALKFLNCSDNQLTSLNVSQNTALKELYCWNNQLTRFDVSKNTALTYLFCYDNQLTSLDVSKNTALTVLECNNTQLTSLDVSKNTALTGLYCYYNQLTSLDVSKNTALESLYCHGNQLTAIDVSQNTALESLYCHGNQLTAIDVSQNTALIELRCHVNQLTSLDVSKNTALTNLVCDNNQLTSLDVSKNTELTFLQCPFNPLTSLDVSGCIALTSLYCFSNQLTSLDVSKNTALAELWCNDNQLTTLDLSNQTKMSLKVVSAQYLTKKAVKLADGRVGIDLGSEGFDATRFTELKADGAKIAAEVSGQYLVIAESVESCPDKVTYKYDTKYPTEATTMDVEITVDASSLDQEIDPVDEDDNIDFGSDMDENSDLDGNVIGDIFYNINTGNGEYNAEEGCIVLKKTTSDETVDGLSGKDIFGEDFKGQFTGIVFKVPAGRGSVKVTAETTGNMLLKVKIGDGKPVKMEFNGKLKISFPYNVSETTFVAIYAGANNEAKGFGTTNDAEDAALKIYGIEFERGETTGVGASLNDNGQRTNDSWYTIDGKKLSGEPTKKGIYIRNGNKVVK